MSQNFTQPFTIPLPVNKGGTGAVTSTGSSGANVLSNSPVITNPTLNQPNIVGITNASSATPGSVGEVISNIVLIASAVPVATNIVKDITSITLSAGSWIVYGNVHLSCPANAVQMLGWIHDVSTSYSNDAFWGRLLLASSSIINMAGITCPTRIFNITFTTTVYLQCLIGGIGTACGSIFAIRIR